MKKNQIKPDLDDTNAHFSGDPIIWFRKMACLTKTLLLGTVYQLEVSYLIAEWQHRFGSEFISFSHLTDKYYPKRIDPSRS